MLAFASSNLYDPYLTAIRSRGSAAILLAAFAGLGLLIFRGYWSRRGIAGKLLVLLWCLPPIALASATTILQLHKNAVLQA